MKTLALLTLLLSFPLYAQGISVITLEDISDQRFEKMGKVIETEKGNLMILEESDNDQKTYSNNTSSKDSLITFTVIPVNKKCNNVISGVVGKAHDISLLITQIVERGYLFQGEKKLTNEITLLQYTNKKYSFLISKEITSTGAYQILFICS